jgi:hypothetical protein
VATRAGNARLARGVRTDPGMTTAIALRLPEPAYLRHLRVLAAWWCLGSSGVQPQLLIRCEVRS